MKTIILTTKRQSILKPESILIIIFSISIFMMILFSANTVSGYVQTSNKITMGFGDNHSINVEGCSAHNLYFQEAIESIGKNGGGEIAIGPGTYYFINSVLINYDNISIMGTIKNGDLKTIITREPFKMSELINTIKVGDTIFRIENSSQFKEGEGIIFDDRFSDFYIKRKTLNIAEVAQQHIKIDAGWECDLYDFVPYYDRSFKDKKKIHENSSIINYYPFFRTYENDPVSNVSISYIHFEGRGDTNEYTSYKGFMNAALHFGNSKNITVKNNIVNNSMGDGISIQSLNNLDSSTANSLIQNNKIVYSQQHGIHPGTATYGFSITDNVISKNIGDGIFFCWNNKYGTIKNNIITYNTNGISDIGGKKPEIFHEIIYNEISHNRKNGIEILRFGENISISNNNIQNNSNGILLRSNSKNNDIINNTIIHNTHNLNIEFGSRNNYIQNNTISKPDKKDYARYIKSVFTYIIKWLGNRLRK